MQRVLCKKNILIRFYTETKKPFRPTQASPPTGFTGSLILSVKMDWSIRKWKHQQLPIPSSKFHVTTSRTQNNSVIEQYPLHSSFIACHNGSSGSGETTDISSWETGWIKLILWERREIEPSGLLRLAPYFRSPLIGQPIVANWQRIWWWRPVSSRTSINV